jgi:phosphotransferase system IIA component
LPKPVSRRALLRFGGTVLKTLFGSAVISDVTLLHEMFDEWKLNQKDVFHSVANQLTYIKKLDTVAKVNTDAIANLSSIVKGKMISSHEKFQQIAPYLL